MDYKFTIPLNTPWFVTESSAQVTRPIELDSLPLVRSCHAYVRLFHNFWQGIEDRFRMFERELLKKYFIEKDSQKLIATNQRNRFLRANDTINKLMCNYNIRKITSFSSI